MPTSPLNDQKKSLKREKTSILKKGTQMAKWILGYCLSLVCLFTVWTLTLSFTTAVWGFVSLFAGCTIAVLALWWQGERQVKNAFFTQGEDSFAFAPAPRPEETNAQANFQDSQQDQDWLPLNEGDVDLLETYMQDLTERVGEAHPSINREHVDIIVRTVIFQLFGKRMMPTACTTPASILTPKIARAA
jgi:hypothetical protein